MFNTIPCPDWAGDILWWLIEISAWGVVALVGIPVVIILIGAVADHFTVTG